jgi:hypothetical protein
MNNLYRNAAQQSFFVFIALLLGLFIPFKNSSIFETLPIVLIILLSSIQITKSIYFGWTRLHEQVFWIFNFIWLGIAPLVQQLSGIRPLPFDVSSSDYKETGWLILISLLVYSFFVELKFNVRKSSKRNRSKDDIKKLFFITYLSAFLSVIVITRIGPAVFLQSREEFNKALFQQGRIDNSQGAILTAVCCVPIFVCMIALQLQLLNKNELHLQKKLQQTFKLILILNIFVNNPISQGRFWFCTVWGTLILIRFWRKTHLIRYFPLLGIMFALLIFPISDVFRYGNSTAKLNVSNPISMLQSKGDFDSYEQISWGVKYVESEGFTKGSQILGATVFAIPRSLWPEKPRDTGIILGKAANFKNLSLSAPIWIEGYIDGGIILMCVYLFLFAIAHARFRQLANLNPGYTIIFVMYQLVILRGSLIQSMGFTCVLLITIYSIREFGVNTNEI